MKGNAMPSEWIWKGMTAPYRVWDLKPRKMIWRKKLREIWH